VGCKLFHEHAYLYQFVGNWKFLSHL